MVFHNFGKYRHERRDTDFTFIALVFSNQELWQHKNGLELNKFKKRSKVSPFSVYSTTAVYCNSGNDYRYSNN
jgi:hypothetical protein